MRFSGCGDIRGDFRKAQSDQGKEQQAVPQKPTHVPEFADKVRLIQEVDVFILSSCGGNTKQIARFTGHPTVTVTKGVTEKHTPTSISAVSDPHKKAETSAVANV